jgi:hypothetical protein
LQGKFQAHQGLVNTGPANKKAPVGAFGNRGLKLFGRSFFGHSLYFGSLDDAPAVHDGTGGIGMGMVAQAQQAALVI